MRAKRYAIKLTAGQLGHLKMTLRVCIWDIEQRQRAFAGNMTPETEENLREVKACAESILDELKNCYRKIGLEFE